MPKEVCDCCGHEADLREWSKWHLCEICRKTRIGTTVAGANIDRNHLAMAIAWIGNEILDAIHSKKVQGSVMNFKQMRVGMDIFERHAQSEEMGGDSTVIEAEHDQVFLSLYRRPVPNLTMDEVCALHQADWYWAKPNGAWCHSC